MQWLRNLFRKPVVPEIPNDGMELLVYLIDGLGKVSIRKDAVIDWSNSPLRLHRPVADRYIRTVHDCLHIIRSKLYFTELLKQSLTATTDVDFYDYMTDPEGYYYRPSSFRKELIDKLTNIHYLLDTPQYTEWRFYYLKQLEPVLQDATSLLQLLSSNR